MLRRIALKDFAIVAELELELDAGFSVLTGETGAGKSILVDALQLALGARGESVWVREGAARTEVLAEFDTPPSLHGWLDEAGFERGPTMLLRRTLDAQGRSRAWVNGSGATVAQLREAAEHLVEIHGQHAWQSLTRPAAVRALLDAQSAIDTVAMTAAWSAWQAALERLGLAREQQGRLDNERERLQWQLGELTRLAPSPGEWEALNAEHTRLSNAQALNDAVREALQGVDDGEPSATTLTARALQGLTAVGKFDPALQPVADVLAQAQAQLGDAAHSLAAYLRRSDPNPARLQALDHRVSSWLQLARRHRRSPQELPALLQAWQGELAALEANADVDALQRAAQQAEQAWRTQAAAVSKARRQTAPRFAAAVTQAMQTLGMEGGRFEVQLEPLERPQSFGLEQVAFCVAGHAGAPPRPLSKVASGGELSRLSLAIAVSALGARGADSGPATMIFDEIDVGVGGAVADSVGRLMKQLGARVQVLAVTHLAQVAACADAHFVVIKSLQGERVASHVQPVAGEARVSEVARMLGGERLSGTSRAHAQAMLDQTR